LDPDLNSALLTWVTAPAQMAIANGHNIERDDYTSRVCQSTFALLVFIASMGEPKFQSYLDFTRRAEFQKKPTVS